MQIDPPARVSQENESKDLDLLSRSLLRLIESRACSGVYIFDSIPGQKEFCLLYNILSFLYIIYKELFLKARPGTEDRTQGLPGLYKDPGLENRVPLA